MTTQNTIKCSHTFCTLPARAYSRRDAAYKVDQIFPSGKVMTTYVCEDDMYHMSKVLKDTDTVTVL